MKNKNFTSCLFLLITCLSGLLLFPAPARSVCREIVNTITITDPAGGEADANSGTPIKSNNLGLAEENYTCFLTGVTLHSLDSQDEHASCKVYIDGVSNQWVLEAKVTKGDEDAIDATAGCMARCFKWEYR